MQRNFPSVKTLALHLGIVEADAVKVRKIMMAATRNEVTEMSDKAAKYVQSCYHLPPLYLVKLYAIDEILGTHGVEGFDHKGGYVDYCNTGDSYASTVIYTGGRFIVASWGDIVEG